MGMMATNSKVALYISVNYHIVLKIMVFVVVKKSIDVIDNIKMHDVPNKEQLASKSVLLLPIIK